jgi:hypothetical protein
MSYGALKWPENSKSTAAQHSSTVQQTQPKCPKLNYLLAQVWQQAHTHHYHKLNHHHHGAAQITSAA